MIALDLFLRLTAAGCQLTRQDDTLRVHDPHHVLTDDLRQAIWTHKAALLAMLTPERRIPLPRVPAPCWRCQGRSERQGMRYLLCPACEAAMGAQDDTLSQRDSPSRWGGDVE